MLRKFNPAAVHPPGAPYSHGVEATGAQRLLFISGQVGVRPDGTTGDGIAEQAQIAVGNLKAVLADAGMGVKDLVKVTIYLTDEANLPGFMGGAAGLSPAEPPATTLLVVKGLASPALLVEIEGIAAK